MSIPEIGNVVEHLGNIKNMFTLHESGQRRTLFVSHGQST